MFPNIEEESVEIAESGNWIIEETQPVSVCSYVKRKTFLFFPCLPSFS